jgi:prepilin peptidase CpaA
VPTFHLGSAMIEHAALFAFPALMAFAASSDLLTMTISNRISIALVLCFFALAAAVQMPLQDVLMSVSCGLLVLALAFALFCFGWIGGGDAKLAAATALWLGWAHVLDYGLVASVFGGILTLVLVQLRRWPLPQAILRHGWVARLHAHDSGVPYGIALAAAGLVIYPHSQLWRMAVGT